MARSKENKDNQLIVDKLTDESKQILEEFIKYYARSSNTVYKNAVVNLVYSSKIYDFRKFTFENYISIDEDATQGRHKRSFIRYLYAYGYLEEEDGFIQELESKERIKDGFEKLINKTNQKKEPKYKPLPIAKLWEIKAILEEPKEDIDELKMKFCWYMLFETDCSTTDLRRNIKASNYKNGQIILDDSKKFKVPEEFDKLFNKLREREYDGFSETNTYIETLGKMVGIEGLVPQHVVATRKANMITCSNCYQEYTNSSENWVSANKSVICRNCYETLKKKYKIKAIDLDKDFNESKNNYIYDSTKDEAALEEKRKKMPKKINYLKLHEFQIKIGDLGEDYVYIKEKERLSGTRYVDKIDKDKAKDSKNGYDILSYDKETGKEIFIEVKTTVVKQDKEFFITKTELDKAEKAKKEGCEYWVYRVFDILNPDKEQIQFLIIKNITECKKEETQWKVKI